MHEQQPQASAPPDELAILREARAADAGILGESAVDHLANALQILNTAPLISLGGGLATYSIDDVDAIRERINQAVELLEAVGDATVLTAAGAQPFARFMADLAAGRSR